MGGEGSVGRSLFPALSLAALSLLGLWPRPRLANLTPGVNDNDNTAAWAPVNVATNLILSNSNSSVLPQPILLVQNREYAARRCGCRV